MPAFAKCVPSPPVLGEPPLPQCGRRTAYLPVSLPLEAGFQKCESDVESCRPLRAILQVLASLKNLRLKGLLQISANYFMVPKQFG